MIGYYVHHHGRGHLHRALAIAAQLAEPVTFLSSLPPPAEWLARPAARRGEWVVLDRDDRGVAPADPDAGGRLHWVPVADAGLSRRMRQVSTWLDRARPRLVVVDVSVEVALLARLHGVPVVTAVLPGRRADPAHLLGFDVASEVVGFWPEGMTDALLPDLPERVRRRVRAVGAVARFPVDPVAPVEPPSPAPDEAAPRSAVLLAGAGGSALDDAAVDTVVGSTPGWRWTVLGPGSWVDDPRPALRSADVVVTHAGQNALAEVAALRRPAVVVPQQRPHDEQVTTARALRDAGWPVLVDEQLPLDGWSARLEAAARIGGGRWTAWCDGRAAERFAAVVGAVGTEPGQVA
ncbi:putative glycosyltransferase [Nocardioides sp. J9]|uniref:glycosyltransferase n=1 Tax=Nocardioides sp. J9 TaxID=935844 RepID=UPI0011A87F1D|nr:glycosyltransferase [Nocardioides sp. J9]TWG99593.1 putative glycosyltransferase [Nocardioides sp. J9]